jgi:hypothetical protein
MIGENIQRLSLYYGERRAGILGEFSSAASLNRSPNKLLERLQGK